MVPSFILGENSILSRVERPVVPGDVLPLHVGNAGSADMPPAALELDITYGHQVERCSGDLRLDEDRVIRPGENDVVILEPDAIEGQMSAVVLHRHGKAGIIVRLDDGLPLDGQTVESTCADALQVVASDAVIHQVSVTPPEPHSSMVVVGVYSPQRHGDGPMEI